jgi:hypothetical protein
MLAERPSQNPGHKLVQTTKAYQSVYFVPDCLAFGQWNSRIEAEDAFPIWLKDYQQKPKEWQSYCKSRGYVSVNFNV